jgi:hypothetical protein
LPEVSGRRGVTFNLSWKEFIDLVAVSDLSAALSTVKQELSALGLIDSAQIAWLDTSEQTWRNEFPRPCATPFEDRLKDADKWQDQSLDLIRSLTALRDSIKNRLPPPPAQ